MTPPANIPQQMTPRETPRPSLADGIPGRRQVDSGRMSEALRAMWIFGRPTLDHYARALQAKNRQDIAADGSAKS